MASLGELGYNVVSLGKIDDTRFGALCRAMGRLLNAEEEQWRANNPTPEITDPPADFSEKSPLGQWNDRLRIVQRAGNQSLRRIVEYANGAPPNWYGGVFAVFKETEPKLYVRYEGYNDDPGPDFTAVNDLYGFDGLADSPEGPEVIDLAIQRVLKGEKQSDVPHMLGIPRELFEPYLKPKPETKPVPSSNQA